MTELTEDTIPQTTESLSSEVPMIDHAPGFEGQISDSTETDEVFTTNPNQVAIARQKQLAAHELLRIVSAEEVHAAETDRTARQQ